LHSNLPHITTKGYYQFVTFRTKDSLDEYISKTLGSSLSNSKKQYQIDNYLDGSPNGSYLNGVVLETIKEYIIKQDKTIFDLISFAIMPNHIHLLFKETIKLSESMRLLKGGSSFLINRVLGRKGQFWANDYYDKTIRDEKHFRVVYEYISNNPIKAGLRDSQNRVYGIYD